ncbi:hypothetical protein KM043_003716 [Ampulex compressa]|nr:hypothetical protein KM043_003716 [Ampulex compressa]
MRAGHLDDGFGTTPARGGPEEGRERDEPPEWREGEGGGERRSEEAHGFRSLSTLDDADVHRGPRMVARALVPEVRGHTAENPRGLTARPPAPRSSDFGLLPSPRKRSRRRCRFLKMATRRAPLGSFGISHECESDGVPL